MKSLNNAVNATVVSLMAAPCSRVSLVRPLVTLELFLRAVPAGGNKPFWLAKRAQRDITDCEHEADRIGDSELAVRLSRLAKTLADGIAEYLACRNPHRGRPVGRFLPLMPDTLGALPVLPVLPR